MAGGRVWPPGLYLVPLAPCPGADPLTPLGLSFLFSQGMTKVSALGGYLCANTGAPLLRGVLRVLPPGWSLSRGSMRAGLPHPRILPEKICSPLTAGLFRHCRPASPTGQNGPHSCRCSYTGPHTGRISTSLTPCLLEARYSLIHIPGVRLGPSCFPVSPWQSLQSDLLVSFTCLVCLLFLGSG